MASYNMDYELSDWQREIIVWTLVVQVPKIYTDAKLAILLPYWCDICNPS